MLLRLNGENPFKSMVYSNADRDLEKGGRIKAVCRVRGTLGILVKATPSVTKSEVIYEHSGFQKTGK